MYRLLTDNIPVVAHSAFASPDGPKLIISGRVKELTGYTAEEFAHDRKLYDRILHADDRERYWAAVNEQIGTHVPLDIEYRIMTKDGVTKWVRDRTVITPNDSGGVRRVDGVLEDVTDRRAAEENLRRREEMYKLLTDHIPVVAYSAFATERGQRMLISGRIKQLTGYTAEEFEDDSDLYDRILHPDDRALYW